MARDKVLSIRTEEDLREALNEAARDAERKLADYLNVELTKLMKAGGYLPRPKKRPKKSRTSD